MYELCTHWWLVRVTFVVAFGFLPQNLGGGGDLQIFLVKNEWCGQSEVVGTLKLYYLVNLFSNFMHSRVVETQKLCDFP